MRVSTVLVSPYLNHRECPRTDITCLTQTRTWLIVLLSAGTRHGTISMSVGARVFYQCTSMQQTTRHGDREANTQARIRMVGYRTQRMSGSGCARESAP